jgi:amidase
MQTSAGSFCLLDARPARDATVISYLRESGAILLGKTNMSEWANYRSSGPKSSDGWSPRGGQTYGAYHKHQNPCGSSSGSAVAVSIGLSVASVGTEVSQSNTEVR